MYKNQMIELNTNELETKTTIKAMNYKSLFNKKKNFRRIIKEKRIIFLSYNTLLISNILM